jgi:hypothetical protein
MAKAILLFFANILYSVVYVHYVRRIAQGNALEATLYDGALMLIIGFSVLSYTKRPIFLIPIVLGAMLGTYIGITYDGGIR